MRTPLINKTKVFAWAAFLLLLATQEAVLAEERSYTCLPDTSSKLLFNNKGTIIIGHNRAYPDTDLIGCNLASNRANFLRVFCETAETFFMEVAIFRSDKTLSFLSQSEKFRDDGKNFVMSHSTLDNNLISISLAHCGVLIFNNLAFKKEMAVPFIERSKTIGITLVTNN